MLSSGTNGGTTCFFPSFGRFDSNYLKMLVIMKIRIKMTMKMMTNR